MKTLNLIAKSALCLLMIQLSLACSESKSKRSSVGIYRAPVKNVSEPGSSASAVGKITGAVVASFSGTVSQENFQDNIMAFATAFMMPEDSEFGLGRVSSVYEEITDTSGTGMRLNLSICLTDGTAINPSQNYSGATIKGGSTPLTIYIKDSKVNEQPDNYSPLEISGYKVTSGTINGKIFSIIFENNLGTITMKGDLSRSNDWLAGEIAFDNKVNFVESGGKHYSPRLGEFYVKMDTLSKNCL